MKSYKTCNCYIKLIASKPGSKKDEHRLHKLCENWLYEREWFYNVPEVKEMFEQYEVITFEEANSFKQFITNRFIELEKHKTDISKITKNSEIDAFVKKVDEIKYYPFNLKPWINFYWQQCLLINHERRCKTGWYNVGIHEFKFRIFWNKEVQCKVIVTEQEDKLT